MQKYIRTILLTISLLFVLCSCSNSDASVFDKYTEYEHINIQSGGTVVVQYATITSFEDLERAYINGKSRSVIMRVKTSEKTVDIATPNNVVTRCPYGTMINATVTEIYYCSDDMTDALNTGDEIWLFQNYFADATHRLIFSCNSYPYALLILPNQDYLLFASQTTITGSTDYENKLIFSSLREGTIPIDLDFDQYYNILLKNKFEDCSEYKSIWQSAIDKYIK